MRNGMRAVGLAAVIVAALAPAAVGQQVPFGASHDASQPVEITSDRLDLDQAAGTAVFAGGVKVGQGALRLAADRVEVSYDEGGGAAAGTVRRMVATGNVTLSNGEEAAEAERATYDVATGRVEMEGNVLLTQGGNALSSQRLRIDLNAGTGQLEGRVQTIFVPGSRP
ncbi:MAG TPA: lipopolysaccharide transport periplasmic protein LptA [Amaricoccus sp.]|nr:lipopolysaccharide transport periplasmic protein LptA [Amaricoccus sp.]